MFYPHICTKPLIYLKKKYITTGKALNVMLLFMSICGNIGFIWALNVAGLKIDALSNKLTAFVDPLNPFIIVMGIFAVSVAVDCKTFYNRGVNYLSGLSLLIYIIHENITVREVYRKYLTNWCMDNTDSALLAIINSCIDSLDNRYDTCMYIQRNSK